MGKDPILDQTVATRGDALHLAEILGCSGAHQQSGGWHPCESHEALVVLINEGIAAYRQHIAKEAAKVNRQGKSRRTTVMEIPKPPKRKRRNALKPKKRQWDELAERGVISIQGGGPGITSGKDAELAVVAVLLPNQDAKKFVQKGGLGFEEFHLTLGYFAKPSQAPPELHEDLVAWAMHTAEHCGPMTMKISGTGEIGDDEPRATVLILSNAKVLEIREDLDQGMRSDAMSRKHPGFIPHMTIGYGIDPDSIKAEGEVTFDHIAIWWGGEHHVFPLQGEKY